ncbi:hypothetical protein BH23CHL5_BH23CHL5_28250 [soil metagenome]
MRIPWLLFIHLAILEKALREEASRILDYGSPAELRALADLFDTWADEWAAIAPPTFAAEWHQAYINERRIIARALREATTLGMLVTLMAYLPDFEKMEEATIAGQESMLEACPRASWIVKVFGRG